MESNFDFLNPEFKGLFDIARRAEGYANSDARACCVYARMALETAVLWIYEHDNRLQMPYDTSLGAMLHDSEFRNAVPEQVFYKAKAIQKAGNLAVHELKRPVKAWDARSMVRELFHTLYWLAKTYHRQPLSTVSEYRSDLLPPKESVVPADDSRIKALEARLAKQAKELKEKEDELDEKLRALQEQVAAARENNQKQKDTHDYGEADTRKLLIDLDLKRSGWLLDRKESREYEVRGMPNPKGIGYADYVLWGDDGKPLAVIEAKRTTENVSKGQQQAMLYADCLEQMHGVRPIIYYTNGYQTFVWDDQVYPPRQVSGYHNQDELELMIQRRETRQVPSVKGINQEIAGRYYQKRAIGSLAEAFVKKQRKGLLVMATGTGKTRTSIALVDLLQRSNWVKRTLFLADRRSLVKQVANAFKSHLPESSPVNLVTEKGKDGRVYVCTYPTMMGLIDETDKGVARFGPGFFDLIIVDEAHRSIYQRYQTIFDYFDSLLVGLTATPREEVDRNTYEMFDLEEGVPNDAYELDRAVSDEFLVPPKALKVELRFPREGIDYNKLSEEEKRRWESLDWGDDGGDFLRYPPGVNAGAINSWLFNDSTADNVLKILMEQGHKVEGGDRLAKTIIFARNHDHAEFIEKRFNHHYPHLKGSFARVIDNKVKYADSLIDAFSIADKEPHIAISVDMMDTGIDVPEVANLVFFKPVYSKIKFWQMIGRGTRLCPDLFGEGQDKVDFRVFDCCANFDFFNENPDGIEGGAAQSVSTRLFNSRVRIIGLIDSTDEVEASPEFRDKLVSRLREEVRAMPKDNFLVRRSLETVERFQGEEAWARLDEDSMDVLHAELAGLPTTLENEKTETKQFDLLCLRMQLALLEGAQRVFETNRTKVVAIAEHLETKPNVPAIAKQLAYIQAIQNTEFWEGVGVDQVEELRVRLRELAQFVEKGSKKIIYTDFEDEVLRVQEDVVVAVPRMTSVQYEKKVTEYLKSHLDNIAIRKVQLNESLTEQDLEALETMLLTIGNEDGRVLLDGLLERNEAPTLPYFIRKLVGLDRKAAQALLAQYLDDRSLSPTQIRFIELLIDELTSRGVMEEDALYESPFSDLHDGGPDSLFAGKDNVVDGIFRALDTAKRSVFVE